ncbi:MAG: hypothetical protein R2764_07175 [Bacteroidales bacterium]
MNSYLTKSEINKDAAVVLFEKSFYGPSVNCLYYSCLQYFISILISKFGYTEDKIKVEISLDKKGGSHGYYINTTIRHLNEQTRDRGVINNIRRKINTLKVLREDAEYKSIIIDSGKNSTALSYHDEIFRTLRSLN